MTHLTSDDDPSPPTESAGRRVYSPPTEAHRAAQAGSVMDDLLHGGLDPEALFGGVTFLDDRQTLQWLGHLQRLASTGLLAGSMAHDLAGLVQPLLGECDRSLLSDDPLVHREGLVRMREWARRCGSYVRALLDLVRRDERQRAPVPVESVVEETLLLLESAKRLADVSITRHLDNAHLALIDRTRLMQALVNLLSNAIRAAKAGGREVIVSVRGWRGWVLVEVEDNGPGVPPEVQERIFHPFVHRAPEPVGGEEDPEAETPAAREARRRANRRRTGLGLYITRRLIGEQGGRIEYETEQGVGSTFRIMLEPVPGEGMHGSERPRPPRAVGDGSRGGSTLDPDTSRGGHPIGTPPVDREPEDADDDGGGGRDGPDREEREA